MPLYDYKCTNCQKVTEVRHGFDETHSDPCPACGGRLSRVFNPAPILFKGSGFYVTDSRAKTEAASKSESTEKPAAESTAPKESKEKKEPSPSKESAA